MNKMKLFSLIAFVAMIFCFSTAWSQSERKAETSSTGVQLKKGQHEPATAATELRNYKPESSDPNDLRLTLLQAKEALERGLSENRLNDQQIAAMKAKIAQLESDVQNRYPEQQATAVRTRENRINVPEETSPAREALRDYKATSPIAKVNELQLARLQVLFEMEKLQMEGNLSPEEAAGMQTKVTLLETQIRNLELEENRRIEMQN